MEGERNMRVFKIEVYSHQEVAKEDEHLLQRRA